MPSDAPQDDPISTRCGSCGARFEVDQKFKGRVVECTQCGHSFKIQGHVSQHIGRHYPGERRDPLLDQVAKVSKPLPKADAKGSPDSFASQSSPVYGEPLSPQRLLARALALSALTITALVLVLGASHGGALAGVSITNRILMASFVGLLATILLIYSNTRSWWLMLLLGLSLGGGLVSLPFFFQGGSGILGEELGRQTSTSKSSSSQKFSLPDVADLRDLIGIKPLEKERQALFKSGSRKTALGLWLRGLDEHNKLLIKEYVIREMNASTESHFYPRGKGDFLMVVTGIGPDLEKLSMVAEALGDVKGVIGPLHTVEVAVNNANFKSGPIEKLTNPQDLDFYRLNAIELKSIDLDRVSSAVRRLSEAEPVLLRDDIEQRLVKLLDSTWYDKKRELCRALLVWSQKGGDCGKVALQQAVILHRNDEKVSPEMIALCIKQEEADVLPLLHKLWKLNPIQWEPWFAEAGNASERVILLGFDDSTGVLRQSACRILGQVGGELSLPILRVTASTAADKETRIVANSSIQMIEKRLAKEKDTH